MLCRERIFSFRIQSETKRGDWKGNINHQSRLERWKGFQGMDEDDELRRRRCQRRFYEEGRVERGESEHSLQMYYSKGEIIAGLYAHSALMTGSFKWELGFPLQCSLGIDLRSMVHTTVRNNKGGGLACTIYCLLQLVCVSWPYIILSGEKK